MRRRKIDSMDILILITIIVFIVSTCYSIYIVFFKM